MKLLSVRELRAGSSGLGAASCGWGAVLAEPAGPGDDSDVAVALRLACRIATPESGITDRSGESMNADAAMLDGSGVAASASGRISGEGTFEALPSDSSRRAPAASDALLDAPVPERAAL